MTDNRRRLDALASALAQARPVLDDVARARVAQRLELAASGVQPGTRLASPVAGSRRWWRWVPLAAAAAAAIVLVLARGDRAGDLAETTAIADGATIVASPDTSVHGELDGATLALYGPGWARRTGDTLVVDAQALVVDRTRGETALAIAYRSVAIRVIRATFAVDGAHPTRVSVMRGEVELTCDGATRAVTAGASATCGSVITARSDDAARLEKPDTKRDAPGSPRDVVSSSADVPDATTRRSPDATTAKRDAATSKRSAPDATTVAATAKHDDPNATTAKIDAGDAATAKHDNPDVTAAKRDAANRGVAATSKRDAAVTTAQQPDATTVQRDATDMQRDKAISTQRDGAAKPSTPDRTSAADPAARYAAAERLMHSDRAGARRALAALVAEYPAAPEAAPALLDLARLALADGDTAEAQRSLDRLASHPSAAALAMPAAYQRCLVELRTGGDARTCLTRFRATFPGSLHDADALARLAAATAASDCAAARPLLDEYARRYPRGVQASALARWRERCR